MWWRSSSRVSRQASETASQRAGRKGASSTVSWFFATPVIYPWFDAPEGTRRFLSFNPMTHVVVSYQEILFFEGPFGHLPLLLLLGAISIVFFLCAYFVFDRLRDTFAEEV